MPRLSDPPIRADFAVPATKADEAKFLQRAGRRETGLQRLEERGGWPKLAVGLEWLKWLTDFKTEIEATPSRRGSLSLSAQTASLPTTPIPIGSLNAGLWRISYYTQVQTPDAVSSSLQMTFFWELNGITQSEPSAVMNGNLTTTHQFGTLVVRIDAGTPISVATTYATAGGSPMAYSLDVSAEELSSEAT